MHAMYARRARGTVAALLLLLSAAVLLAGCDTTAPRVASSWSAESPRQLTGTVGAVVSPAPELRVLDQRGRPLADVAVAWLVSPGSGSIARDSTRTNVQGVATAPLWTLGTIPGVQTLSASVTGLETIRFDATVTPGAPASFTAATPVVLQGATGLAIAVRPAVRVRDAFGNAVGGVAVSFSLLAGTPMAGNTRGVITGTRRTTGTDDGIARVGEWVLGDDDLQLLLATSPAFPRDTILFRATTVASAFTIDARFVNGAPSMRHALAVERAIERWRRVIVGPLPPVRVAANAGECGPGVPTINNETISDLRIYINLDSIDGPRGVLGRAGPCLIRTATGLPVVGYVELDTADLTLLDSIAILDDVMAHEFGHVLGLQAFNWDLRGLAADLGTDNPYYRGAAAREQFQMLGGVVYPSVPVPLENTGNVGTRDSHWRLSVLKPELMVGFAQRGGMPLSRITAAALADLGYQVRLERAEPFTVTPVAPLFLGGVNSAGLLPLGDDAWPSPVWSVDANGTRTLVRGGDWRVTRQRK